MKTLNRLLSWKIVLAIQLIASVALGVSVFQLNILPPMYFAGGCALLALLWILMFFFIKPGSKHVRSKGKSYIRKIVSLLLSFIMVLGSIYVVKFGSAFTQITNISSTLHYAVLVLDESDIKDLKDLKNETINYSLAYDEDTTMNQVINEAHKVESSLQFNLEDEYTKLATSLFNGEVNAILVNTAYNSMFEGMYPEFETGVREIWASSVKAEKIDIAKNVDTQKETFTIYVSGIDTTGPVTTVSRSDVNLLVTVNPEEKQILMTSIPRDAFVTLANKGMKDKLTHSGLAGVENSVKTIEDWLGITINYYARVNFTSLTQIVDALGGVEVYSPYNFVTRHGKFSIHKGVNSLNGIEALGFVRERYALPNGDYDRGKNQIRLLKAMINKAISPAIITKYSSVLKAVAGAFQTNMPADKITALIKRQLNSMDQDWEIMTNQIVGTGVKQTGGAYAPNQELYYMIPDETSVQEVTQAIITMQQGEMIQVESEDDTATEEQ